MTAHSGSTSLAYRAFRAMPGPVHRLGDAVLRWRAEREFASEPEFSAGDARLIIGPLNTAGQADQWASAARRHLPGVSALSLWAERGSPTPPLGYPADIQLRRTVQLRGQRPWQGRLLSATHVIAESGFPLLGDVRFGDVRQDLSTLGAAGVRTALVFHGSELRDLHRHAALYPDSPFAQEWDERFTRMQERVERNRQIVEEFDGPVLVTTPDMLDFVPGAIWLPLVVDVDRWTDASAGAPVLQRSRPVVLHAPTNPVLKGTAAVEEVLLQMQDEGTVEYRRLQGVPHEQMAAFVADADIVVDQVVLGNAGVLATEAMAAGRLVITHLSDAVRQRCRDADAQHDTDVDSADAEQAQRGGSDIPVLDATPSTLRSVLESVLADRDAASTLAAQGPKWVARHHDGRRTARVLETFLRG